MKGILVVGAGVMKNVRADVRALIDDFVARGSLISGFDNAITSERVVDHPDFDVEDATYTLVVRDFPDPDALYLRAFKLSKLQRIDPTGKFITVKDYTT